MRLAPGLRLGFYEIQHLLGVGGMGEVYRSRDTRLNRDVALKILPDKLVHDPDRVARFHREAQVLASLNHPNIAAIYGFEEADGLQALVLELVEGPTLADRITNGSIPLEEALPIAKQIAEALETAHEQGIIHRDLKPANIKLRPDGRVKVLDFGLAKIMEAGGAGKAGDAGALEVSQSPTITSPAMMTGIGVILGTAAYMSPEQAKGRPADRRSDIWAFGCVLYEMLTGKRPFEGDDVSDTLANVLKSVPNWNALPSDTPPAIVALLKRCLERDPHRRIGHTSALLFVLGDPQLGSTSVEPVGDRSSQPVRRFRRATWAVAATVVLALILTTIIAVRHLFEPPARVAAVEFTIAPPDKSNFGGPELGGGTGVATQLSVSPDGQHVVFVASGPKGFVLWLRSLVANVVRPIQGTEGAAFPFWSPDSRFIGFFADGKLKKVQFTGGPPIVLCDAPVGRGGTWNTNNVIVFAPTNYGGLQRVSGAGGPPAPLMELDNGYGEINHRFPSFLPDGDHFFYTAVTGVALTAPKPSLIKIGALSSKESTTLVETESSAAYSSGHAFFLRDRTLMAQPFDPVGRHATGDPFPVADRISTEGSRYAAFAISTTGVLVYAHGEGLIGSRLTWRDRSGKVLGVLGDAGLYTSVALSPDERRVVVASPTAPAISNSKDLWTIEIDRNLPSRLTFDSGDEGLPVWSPDGSRIAFRAAKANEGGIHVKTVGGTGAEESLMSSSGPLNTTAPSDWSHDGKFIAYTSAVAGNTRPAGNNDIWILPLVEGRKPFAFAETSFNETQAVFSPDSRWIAYTSYELGRPQVFVQPFPQTSIRKQLSRDGGVEPMWRGDGRELFFLASDGTMMAVPITTNDQIDVGAPQPLFASGAINIANARQYAVTKDGQRFLEISPPQQSSAPPLTVVVNWPATVQK